MPQTWKKWARGCGEGNREKNVEELVILLPRGERFSWASTALLTFILEQIPPGARRQGTGKKLRLSVASSEAEKRVWERVAAYDGKECFRPG